MPEAMPSGDDEMESARILRERLGRNLAGARVTVGWSQAELARRIGYSRSTYPRADGRRRTG